MTNGERKEKKTFGPSGSQISPDYWAYNKYLIPQLRIPADKMDADTFKELLEEQEKRGKAIAKAKQKKSKEKMSKDEFWEIYTDPLAPKKRKARNAKKRMVQGLEWHHKHDIHFWEDQQLIILEQYVDQKRKEEDEQMYEIQMKHYEEWCEKFTKRAQNVYQNLLEEQGKATADEFADMAYKYMEDKEPQKPKELEQFTKIIRRRVRQFAIRKMTTELLEFAESMKVLGSGSLEKKSKIKKKPKKKKKDALPKGKVPYPEEQE